MPNLEVVNKLFERYLDGSCTSAEVKQLMQYFKTGETEQLDQLVLAELERPEKRTNKDYQPNIDRVYSRIQEQLHPAKMTRRLWPRLLAAASILFFIGAGIMIAMLHKQEVVYSADIKPYSRQTILKTGSGKSFVLGQLANGIISRQGYTAISKTVSQQIAYTADEVSSVTVYDTIEVPAGGRPQQLILSDGSKILLNAATTLRFPENLNHDKGNEMKLIAGEIYCEIIHNPKAPLKIITPLQVTEDIGTRFDISAYPDEPIAQTTLLQGAVQVSSGNHSKLLSLNEMAVTANGQLSVQPADADETLAWKNGYFRFNGLDLSAIMRQLSRWYNIDVLYEGAVTNNRFYGKISRSKNISEVLRMLEKTKTVHFKIEVRRVTVMP